MKKRNNNHSAPVPDKNSLEISDGSMSGKDYDAKSYSEFLSNGRTNNEKIEAEEYFDSFLREK